MFICKFFSLISRLSLPLPQPPPPPRNAYYHPSDIYLMSLFLALTHMIYVDMCSQLDAGSRFTSPLTNVPPIFQMMFQHVFLTTHHPNPILFFSRVHVCFYRQEVTGSQCSFFSFFFPLSLLLAASVIYRLSICWQTSCGSVCFSLHTQALIQDVKKDCSYLKPMLEIKGG